jgi:hypothetical protein
MKLQDRIPSLILLVFALVVVYGILSREGFVSEFLDRTNLEKTQETIKSSYQQQTNAVVPNKSFDAPPIQGVISPFRVNIWDSYIP